MCAVCFTTAQLVPAGAIAARWWYVNRRRQGETSDIDVGGRSDDVEIFVPAEWSSDEASPEPVILATLAEHRSVRRAAGAEDTAAQIT